jgi:hypothetical protein
MVAAMNTKSVKSRLDNFERVRAWNTYYPVGQMVKTTSADGGFDTITIGHAYLSNSGIPYIRLKRGGLWLLEFVEVVK